MATQPHPASENLIPFNRNKIFWDYILGTTVNILGKVVSFLVLGIDLII